MRTHWTWKVVFLAAALGAAAAGGFFAVRTTTSPAVADERVVHAPAASNPTTVGDEKAIEKIRSAYVKAFNAGNAKAVAAFWAADGEFVDTDGRSFRGRRAIEKEFTAFFAEAKGQTLQITLDSLRFVGPGVALESGSARLTSAADGAATRAVYHIVHTKRDGQWQLTSVREAPYALASNYEHLRDLEWLVGNWTATSDGKKLELACEWTGKRNFLIRRYTLTGAAGGTRTGTQVIGWDPVLGGVRSWVFDSDCGFGSEQWIKDGQRWVLEATGVTPDGDEFEATNVLTRLDHDSFTWRSVRRELNHVGLPDTKLIKVTRVKAKK